MIIEELHPKARPGWTLFVLGLEVGNDEYCAVKTCLEEIRPEMLLFTRRLREIEITFREAERRRETHSWLNNPENVVERISYNVKIEEACSQIYTITSASVHSQTEVRYFRQEFEVPNMPNHPSRLGMTESKIILAFPFNAENHPIIGEQNIFAFMPLRKTRFPVCPAYTISDEFLIQGDFLTQTSREGIREQEPWNIKLRDNIPQCFAKGLTNMITHPNLAIESIKFIPYSDYSLGDKFLAPVVQQILSTIRKLPVIRASSGGWIHPARALIVPKQLRFEDNPLFSEREIRYGTKQPYEYIDSAYDSTRTITLLKALGCQTLDFELVFSVISSPNFPFQEKPYTWFAILFQYLNGNEHMSRKKARIPSYLKLNDGSWTSVSKSRDIFLPLKSIREEDVPSLDIAILHDKFHHKITQTAAATVFLRNMMQITELSDTDIIRAIVKYHRGARDDAGSSLTVDVCLKHTAYLTQRQHMIQGSDCHQLQEVFHFVDHKKAIVRGAENMVLDWEISGDQGASTTLSQLCKSSALHFLSKDYPHRSMQFIQNRLGIKLFPPFTEKTTLERLSKRRRLVQYESEIVSAVYTELLAPKRRCDNILLDYLSDLLHTKHLPQIPFVFRERLREFECLCENGSLAKLQNCFLRTGNLAPFLSPEMNILAVSSPNDPKWTYLETVGVSMQPNLEIFLQSIRRSKSEVIDYQGINTDVVNKIYKDIVLFCNGSVDSENSRCLRLTLRNCAFADN
jgi:hypothetical protein